MNLNIHKIKQNGDRFLKNFNYEHNIAYIKEQNSILLLGQSIKKNQIFLFSLDKNSWSTCATNGRKPTSRRFYASYYDQKEQVIYIHGGSSEPGRSLDDFHALYLKTWTWKKIFCQISKGREGHCMVQYKGNLIIHGGISYPEDELLNDVWVVKGKAKYTQQSQLHGFTYQKLNIKGFQPPARKHHKSFIHKDQLFVIGGQTNQNVSKLCIYSLSLTSNTWRQIKTPTNLKHRSNFSLVLNKSNNAIIFGGENYKIKRSFNQVFVFNPQTQNIEICKLNEPIAPRSNHSMVVSSLNPFKAWLVGGQNSNEPIDIYQFYENQFNTKQDYDEYLTELQNQIQLQNKQQSKLQKTLAKLQASQQSHNDNEALVQNILMLIKSEQYLSQEYQKKDITLENLLKSMQSYTHILYQNYKKYQQDTEIEEIKQNHIYICLKLKETYKNIDRLNKKNNEKIHQYRSSIASMNRELQGFMETEADQDSQY